MRRMWKYLMMLVVAVGMFSGMTFMSFAANGDIASGVIDESYGQITWRIDKNGHLTVEGWGDFADPAGKRFDYWSKRIPWYEYRDRILSARIDLERMKDASYLFLRCSNMTSIDLKEFQTDEITSMADMFCGCESLTSLDLSKWDTGNVTDMSYMFSECEQLQTLNVNNFDTSNVYNMYGMFSGCKNLQTLDLSNFQTSQVTNMGDMFLDCHRLQELDLSNFDTGNVTYTGRMFENCRGLKELNLNNFRTDKAVSVLHMFRNCASLEALDLSDFEINGTYHYLLEGCWKLSELQTPKKLPDNGKELELPVQYESQNWYDFSGREISCITAKTDGSITVLKLENNDFRDVYDDWYVPYVEYVHRKGLMKGYNQFFSPNDSMTRGMVVQTLYNMENRPEVVEYNACEELQDVYRDWYTDAVCWAYNEGITTGYDDSKTFKVDEYVTREQMATFLYRYAKFKGYDCNQVGELSDLYNSWKVSSYALDSVKWAVGAGLISGIERESSTHKDLAPQGTATRAQMAAILMRFCEEYEIPLPDKDNRIPGDAFEWNGHFYKIFDNVPTFELAKVFCKAKEGHLAVIDSEEENEALYNFIKEKGYTSAYFGLSDTAEEGTWTWVNGEDVSYTNWNAEEPGGGTDENYAMFFYLYEDGTWNDGAFKENVYDGGNVYICEWDPMK